MHSCPHICLAFLASVILSFSQPLHAQSAAIWNWVTGPDRHERTSSQILAYYHENRAAFEKACPPSQAQSYAAWGAYKIVESAYLQGDAEFPELMKRADKLADQIAEQGDFMITGVVNAHMELVTAFCQRGDFTLAAELVDRARARLASVPRHLAQGNATDGGASILAGYLGDFATIEKLQLDHLQAAEKQDVQMRKMIGGRMKVASTSTFVLPILAYTQAGCGKKEQAVSTVFLAGPFALSTSGKLPPN
jgi:hypothetical protein